MITFDSRDIIRVMDKGSRQKLADFFSQFQLLHYKEKAIIRRPEDSPQGIFYLHKGYVRLYALFLKKVKS
ncbi:hypothetical protein HY439_03400 [Candidatus Microgenomates bacterium]|nr:hypothetical protein [Candidatus Microgenomates bacterium]